MELSGTTNLPDGTPLRYDVFDPNKPLPDPADTVARSDRSGEVLVKEGNWSAPPIDLSNLSPGRLGVTVTLARPNLPRGWDADETWGQAIAAGYGQGVDYRGDPAAEAKQAARLAEEGKAKAAAARATLEKERRAKAAAASQQAKKAERMRLNAVKVISSWVEYNAIGNPEACVVILNGTKRTLDAYEADIFCYDNFNRPVRHYSSGSNRFRGLSQDRIEPGEYNAQRADPEVWDKRLWLYVDTWTLFGHENTTKIRVKVVRAHFTDNTVWTPRQETSQRATKRRSKSRRR